MDNILTNDIGNVSSVVLFFIICIGIGMVLAHREKHPTLPRQKKRHYTPNSDDY